jgi:hypothetical protein
VSVTYHHYGASLIHAPIEQLRRDMQEMLGMPADIAGGAERTAASHTLSYCPPTHAPGLGGYKIICSLQCVADAPTATFVEWMRTYRPTAPICHTKAFARELAAQDQLICDRLAAKYDGSEVVYMDYTLGAL